MFWIWRHIVVFFLAYIIMQKCLRKHLFKYQVQVLLWAKVYYHSALTVANGLQETRARQHCDLYRHVPLFLALWPFYGLPCQRNDLHFFNRFRRRLFAFNVRVEERLLLLLCCKIFLVQMSGTPTAYTILNKTSKQTITKNYTTWLNVVFELMQHISKIKFH